MDRGRGIFLISHIKTLIMRRILIRVNVGMLMVVVVIAATSCAPSPEELAGQTAIAATTVAAAWTPSPTPSQTPTLTPIRSPTATPEPGRHYEFEGGYSIIPPDGWEIGEIPGFVFKVFFGPGVDDFAANLLVLDEEFEGSLEEYFLGNLLSLEQLFDPLEIFDQEEFSTDLGVGGIRIAIETVQQGISVHQTLYFLEGGDRYFVATCSRTIVGFEEVDALCDASVQTFRLEE